MAELLAVIAIIAILVAIGIPSILSMRRALEFKQLNDYAREVFMAAQSNLSEMRAAGQLPLLREQPDGSLVAGSDHVPGSSNANFPDEDWSGEYFYTVGGDAFDLVLPVGTIDATVRDKNILIEYNPYTGNAYAVFYSEQGEALTYDSIARDEATRKSLRLGYYQGTGLSSQTVFIKAEDATMELVNEQEATLKITVPVPDELLTRPTEFVNGLGVKATVIGNQSAERDDDEKLTKGYFVLDFPAGSGSLSMGNTVIFEYKLDSLLNEQSFASLGANYLTAAGYDVNGDSRALGSISSEATFKVLPGENVDIQAEFVVDASLLVEEIECAPLLGVNPMFDGMDAVEVTKNGTTATEYDLYISNGRHLQNLNAMAPSVAEKVRNVYINEDIYWNETVGYYTATYGDATAANAITEAPGRQMPYFVPITNPKLFGEATFASRSISYFSDVPWLDDNDNDSGKDLAIVNGGGHKISYLNIDTSKYNITSSGYYAGSTKMVNDRFTGLFSYLNTRIQSLHVVNSTIKGTNAARQYNPAAGSLVGVTGHAAFLYDCSAYIDTTDLTHGFSRADMANYGVTGYGAVGGLVGYAKSHNTVSGELTNSEAHLAFTHCFAAVPVTGTMLQGTDGDYRGALINYFANKGYTNGVGGLVGVSMLSNFNDCYASGNVTAYNAHSDFINTRALSAGAGGFVGTSHGTKYLNCFASGDVNASTAGISSTTNWFNNDGGLLQRLLNLLASAAKEAFNKLFDYSDKYGVGGFVGVAYNNEEFNYTVNGSTVKIKQSTYYTNCYAAGTVWMLFAGEKNERACFDGYYPLRNISVDFDWGHLRFVISIDGVEWGGEEGQLYTNVYYLNQTDKSDINNNDILKFLPNISARFSSMLPFYNRCGAPQTFSGLQGVFAANSHWVPGTAVTTHSYSRDGSETYPFKLQGDLHYYGYCPAFVPINGLAYYETYSDNTIGYYLDRDATSTLKNENAVIKSDGYVFMSTNAGTAYATINGASYQMIRSNTQVNMGALYYVYRFNDAALQALATAPTVDGFYKQVSIRLGDTYTMYVNPGFALTQVNPAVTGERQQEKVAVKPATVPETIYIRTARQFYEMARETSYWAYNYSQELDVNADTYTWNAVYNNTKPALVPVGTETVPFTGTYDGGKGYVNKAAIVGFSQSTGADGSYGIFGVIGTDGEVKNLRVEPATDVVELTNATKNAGLVAGVNNGTLSGIAVNIAGNISLDDSNATQIENMGLLVGRNAGTLTGCDVVVSGNAALRGQNVGSVAGVTTTDMNCNLTVTGNVTSTGLSIGGANAYTGGVVGRLESGALTGTLTVGNVVGNEVDGSAYNIVGGLAGFFGGELKEGSIEVVNAESKDGIAAGLAGETANAKISNYAVSVPTAGTIKGAAGAAGVFGRSTKLVVENMNVTVDGTVQATAGNAAGFVLEILDTSSGVNAVQVRINGSVLANGGSAAGFTVQSAASTMTASSVMLNGATISGDSAAGFAKMVSYATGCGVYGRGAINATNEAAGFANRIAYEANQCAATPAAADQQPAAAYLNNRNDNLLINGGTAAGFVNTNNGNLFACYSLAKITGTTTAGFVNNNTGTVRRCEANATMDRGAGFVGTNSGTVRGSYTWYTGAEQGFVTTNSASIFGCYAAPLGDAASEPFGAEGGTYARCYGATPEEPAAASTVTGVTHVSLEDMQYVSADDLNGTEFDWTAKDTNAKYPYSGRLVKYSFPMGFQLAQYGDWKNGPAYSFGLFYYEESGGNTYFDLIDYSDPTYTVEGAKLSFNNLPDNTGTVDAYGYGLFVHTKSQITGGIDPNALDDVSDVISAPAAFTSNSTYTFYKLSSNADVSAGADLLKVKLEDQEEKEINQFFADTIAGGDTLKIRHALQLRNVNGFNSHSFVLDKDITYTGYAAIGELVGALDGANHTVSGSGTLISNVKGAVSNLKVNGATAVLFEQVSGAVNGLNVTGVSAAQLVGTVNEGATVSNLNVAEYNGTTGLIGTVTGTVKDVMVSKANVTAAPGTVGVLVNTVDRGMLQNCTVSKAQLNINCTVDAVGEAPAEVNAGILVGAANKGYICESKTTESGINLTTKASGAANANGNKQFINANIGGAVGMIDNESTLNRVNVMLPASATEGKAISVTAIPEDRAEDTTNTAAPKANDLEAVYTVGGLVGLVKDSDSGVGECNVINESAYDLVMSADVENAGCPAVALRMGGIAGVNSGVMAQDTVTGLTVSNVGAAAMTHETDKVDPAFVPANACIGGLVGVMNKGTLLQDSHVGEQGKPVAVSSSASANTAAAYAVGGAVGMETADPENDDCATYGKDYAVTTISGFSGDATGQFIGAVTNGYFAGCEGWAADSGLKFLGTIYNREDADFASYIAGNYADLTVSAEKHDDPVRVIGASGFSPATADMKSYQYAAMLDECYYQDADGMHKQYIGVENYFYTVGTANDSTAEYAHIAEAEYSRAGISGWSNLYSNSRNTYYYYDGVKYDRFSGVERSGRRGSYVYSITCDSGATYSSSSGTTDGDINANVYRLDAAAHPNMENGKQYMILSPNSRALQMSAGTVTSLAVQDINGANVVHNSNFVFDGTQYEGIFFTWYGSSTSGTLGTINMSSSAVTSGTATTFTVAQGANPGEFTIKTPIRGSGWFASTTDYYLTWDGSKFAPSTNVQTVYLYVVGDPVSYSIYVSDNRFDNKLLTDSTALTDQTPGFAEPSVSGFSMFALTEEPENTAEDVLIVHSYNVAQAPAETEPEIEETEATEPENEATEPETEATEPETEPTVPETTAPETEPTEPVVTDPTEPVTQPEETTAPTEPASTDPTEPASTDPTEPVETEPTEPTEPVETEPTEPTEPLE